MASEAPVQEVESEVAAENEAVAAEVEEKEETLTEEGEEEEASNKENEEPEEDNSVEKAEVVEEGGSGRKRAPKGSLKKEPSQLKEEEEETPEKKEPSSERPTRERKSVERYSAPSLGRSTATKVLSIGKGRGTQLKDIPNVSFKLSKRKADGNLQVLHTILFGKKAKVHSLKRNIGQFSGFVWAENEEKQKAKVREKLDKCVKEKLMDFCDVLNVQINKTSAKKEEVSAKLLEFLESPHVTTDILLADTEMKGKKRKRVASGKSGSPGEASKDPTEKKQKKPQGSRKKKQSFESDDDVDDKAESPEAKHEPHEYIENGVTLKEENDHLDSKSDEEGDEEDESKEQISRHKSSKKMVQKETSGTKSKDKSKPVKKCSPEKSVKSPTIKKSSSSTSKKIATGSASEKQKVEKESPKRLNKEKSTRKKQSSRSPSNSSVNLQGKGKSSKKSKSEPSREDLVTVVVRILKEVDFNTATLSDILRQLGTHFGVDLMQRKAEIKDIITEVINNMSEEEDNADDD